MNAPPEVADLVGLGLTHYEAKGYLGLVGREHATPTEVARLTGLPRQRAYDVLANLAERGLVTPVNGKGVRYRANPPERVVHELIALRTAELQRQQRTGAELVERLTPVFLDGQHQDSPLDYVEVLRDGAHAATRIGRLVMEAQEEVLGFVAPPYLAPPSPEEAQIGPAPVQRAVYEASLLEDPQMEALLRRFAELGEQVRVCERLPLKLMVIDGRTVAFNLPDPGSGVATVTTLIVQHPMLARTLTIAFEAVWQDATPLAGRPR